MVLRKKQIPLNIMDSTDQLTADKISMRPSNIENIRFDKNGRADKRNGITRMGESPIVVTSINNSGYVGNSSGFYGIDLKSDTTPKIDDTPLLTLGVIKRKVFGTSSEIRAIAHARGEKYHFVAFHERKSSTLQETKVFLLDDNFEIVKDISGVGSYLDDDFESVQIVSYQKNGFQWVTIIRQTTTSGGVAAIHFDENGDYDSQDNLFATSNISTIAAVSTGTGYYLGAIDSSNRFILSLYISSSHITVTSTSTAFSGYGVGSITYFSDYVIAIINPIDPSGTTTEAKLVSIPLSTWPTSITPTIRSLVIGGSYLPKWGTVTKVDDTYYVLSLTDYDLTTDMHRSLITKPTKTTSSPASVAGVLTERTCTVGHVFMNLGRAYAILLTPNGYNPIYHLIRQDLTNDYFETISSFLSSKAPTSEFYANGLPGQNPIEGQDQFLYRSQATFSTTTGKLYTLLPIQPLGQEYASWQAIEIDFNSSVSALEAHGTSAISSGCFGTFDGVRYIRGVTAYPEIISTNASGSTYNYQYIAVYKTIDGNGNKIRSLVSPIVSASTGSAISSVATVAVTLAKKAYIFNDYPSVSNVIEQGVYELYRTEHNGVIFYKTGQTLTASGSIITDSTSDTELINNELLYTTGGVLENTYPETCNSICYSNNRIWSIGDDDLIHYSKEFVKGNSIEFNDGLVYRISGNKNIAIGKLGKRQVVFKDRSCYLLYGNPANNVGIGQNLTHQEISSSIGCSNPRSVVEIDSGIMFESHKGIYMISGNGSLSYVGKDVIDYTRDNVLTNSAHIKDKNEVHFAFESGIVLVYNYLFGIWSHDTFNIPSKPDQVFEIAGKAYYDAGGLYRTKDESDSFPYSDKQVLTDYDYAVKYSTGWMKFASVGGFQRVYRFFVLGSKTTEQDLILNVYNDYDDSTPSQTKTFTLSSSDPLEFELHVARQKCESIKFEIVEDIATISNSDLKINALILQVGIKRGYNKLSPDLRQ